MQKMTLIKYVREHAVRGACTCGRCFDAPENPIAEQPKGHTVNLTFFTVAKVGGNRRKFLGLVRAQYPHWLDGKEHSYIEIGGEIGDQGLALMIIGLGGLLGAWQALSPDTVMPWLDDETKMKMAGGGMVNLSYRSKEA